MSSLPCPADDYFSRKRGPVPRAQIGCAPNAPLRPSQPYPRSRPVAIPWDREQLVSVDLFGAGLPRVQE